MRLSEELKWRGFINQTTYQDITELDGAPISFYWGVDPSANSMTIGNLAAAMMVRHFIEHGHEAFLLIGGATGMIGDPDGKADERSLKTLDEIAKNKAAIAAEYQRVFAGKQFTLVDNYDWFQGIGYLDFLRNVGKYVPMSQMLGREFIQARLGQSGSGISYAEFSYALIQGYDFLHLYRQHGVSLQIAASDQWGNSIAGVDLIRKLEAADAHVWTCPLIINKATGIKFGKTEAGAIWLEPEKTSVYKFYQFWLNVDDEGVIDYAKIYTLLSKEEIEALEEQHKQNPSARLAQRTLAREVTTLVHGKERCESVIRVTEVLFGQEAIASLTDEDLDALQAEIPSVEAGKTIVESLVAGHITNSNSEARRLISSGAISLNGAKVTEDMPITGLTLVKKGKNDFILIR